MTPPPHAAAAGPVTPVGDGVDCPGVVVRMLRMLVCFTLLMAASLFPILLFGPALLLVLTLAPRPFRFVCDYFAATWMWFAVALMEKWLGLRVIITGDRMLPGGREQSLIVMNHRTRLDWLYFWAVLVRQAGVANEKIVLKSILKHVPGAGWAMQAAGFLFLDRRWNIDEPYLDDMLHYYHSMDYKTQILLFPEGTDFDARTRTRSNDYARRVGLPTLQHVLHPRTTGFTHLITHLKQKWPDAAVYDVTVAYSTRSFPQTELDILSGLFPSSVHFHVRRHALSSLPDEPALIDEWCRALWAGKERLLDAFSRNLSFKPDARLMESSRFGSGDSGAVPNCDGFRLPQEMGFVVAAFDRGSSQIGDAVAASSEYGQGDGGSVGTGVECAKVEVKRSAEVGASESTDSGTECSTDETKQNENFAAKGKTETDANGIDCKVKAIMELACSGPKQDFNKENEPKNVEMKESDAGKISCESSKSFRTESKDCACIANTHLALNPINTDGLEWVGGDSEPAMISELTVSVLLYLAMAGWLAFVILFLVCFCWSAYVRWASLFQAVFFLIVDCRWGGFERFQARYYRYRRRASDHDTGTKKLE